MRKPHYLCQSGKQALIPVLLTSFERVVWFGLCAVFEMLCVYTDHSPSAATSIKAADMDVPAWLICPFTGWLSQGSGGDCTFGCTIIKQSHLWAQGLLCAEQSHPTKDEGDLYFSCPVFKHSFTLKAF